MTQLPWSSGYDAPFTVLAFRRGLEFDPQSQYRMPKLFISASQVVILVHNVPANDCVVLKSLL
ncbi:hypothetical protein JI435_420410 [Parastagonospora nodorum SN15]|uniref:Uncharacterized protein n=1 Tax=Phaeosphaeria nodorum (strain SN15 / ATCC MYA-4574 / FGSC 10173) TaxID=321614 RepID=A0A7U2I586_PHANO|nr:hypothetical protein JI435_420410 [Parastagonospora nodorum SN15]